MSIQDKNTYLIPIIREYDESKPIRLIFNETFEYLQEGSNIPWIEFNGKKTVCNAMILSNWLKSGDDARETQSVVCRGVLRCA